MNELQKTLNNIKKILKINHVNIKEIKQINHGFQLKLDHPQLTGHLRIYSGRKGIRIDQSQLKLIPGTEIAVILKTALNLKDIPEIEKNQAFSGSIIGCDESGKGDYFGPLVCAAVFVDKNLEQQWKEFSIEDSKNLSDSKNYQIGQMMLSLYKDFVEIAELWPAEYNRQYNQMKKQHLNLNHLLARLHSQAILKLADRHPPDTVIIDQFSKQSLFNLPSAGFSKTLKIIEITRAEKYMAVAAASVIARYRYLTVLDELSSCYNLTFPKGAGRKVEKFAQNFVQKHSRKKLNEVAKVHFKTTSKIDVLEFDC